ncbi:hypothetical protein SK128_026919 [Halocaridina rubra]|uniref:Uncharacterized protein n=1 Tax=Halocaridina rubra TaxID=373956 RepID=A0AAN9ABQ6_HALRR
MYVRLETHSHIASSLQNSGAFIDPESPLKLSDDGSLFISRADIGVVDEANQRKETILLKTDDANNSSIHVPNATHQRGKRDRSNHDNKPIKINKPLKDEDNVIVNAKKGVKPNDSSRGKMKGSGGHNGKENSGKEDSGIPNGIRKVNGNSKPKDKTKARPNGKSQKATKKKPPKRKSKNGEKNQNGKTEDATENSNKKEEKKDKADRKKETSKKRRTGKKKYKNPQNKVKNSEKRRKGGKKDTNSEREGKQDKDERKKQTQDKVKGKKQTQDKDGRKKQTQDKDGRKKQTQDKVKGKKQIQDKDERKKQTKDIDERKKQTQDKVKGKKQTKKTSINPRINSKKPGSRKVKEKIDNTQSSLIEQRQSASKPTNVTRLLDVCDASTTLDYNEKILVYSNNNKKKMICKARFKSKPFTNFKVSCLQFNLNKRGCGKEKVILSAKENGVRVKKTFCKNSKPDEVLNSDKMVFKYNRKRINKNNCSGGFVCVVHAYITVDRLIELYEKLQRLQSTLNNVNSLIALAKYYIDLLLRQIEAILNSGRRRRRSVSSIKRLVALIGEADTAAQNDNDEAILSSGGRRRRSVSSLERLVALIGEADTAAQNDNDEALSQLLAELQPLLDAVDNLRIQIAENPAGFDLAAVRTLAEAGLQSIIAWQGTYEAEIAAITNELADLNGQITIAGGTAPPPLPSPTITIPTPIVITAPVTTTVAAPLLSSPQSITTAPGIVLTTQSTNLPNPPTIPTNPATPLVTEAPPPVITTPPIVTGAPPSVITTPPIVTGAPPPVITTPPIVTGAPPPVITTPPIVTGAPPSVITTPPTITGSPPPVITPPLVTEAPPAITTLPIVTGAPPPVITTPAATPPGVPQTSAPPPNPVVSTSVITTPSDHHRGIKIDLGA